MGDWTQKVPFLSPIIESNMADGNSKKAKKRRKQEENQDFFVIRAKGQFLRLPKGDQEEDGAILGDKGTLTVFLFVCIVFS